MVRRVGAGGGATRFGGVPHSLPAPGLPDVSWQRLLELLPAALSFALLGAIGRLSNSAIANAIASFYVSFFRGTPLLLQLLFWYLALPQVGLVFDPIICAVGALGMNYGAYMTEIFRAGIQSISYGQREAAIALGMTPWQVMRRVVLPQAIRIIIPDVGNQFIAMQKDSALVYVMGVWEITYLAKIGRAHV